MTKALRYAILLCAPAALVVALMTGVSAVLYATVIGVALLTISEWFWRVN